MESVLAVSVCERTGMGVAGSKAASRAAIGGDGGEDDGGGTGRILALPKSMSFKWPEVESRRFSGFRSLHKDRQGSQGKRRTAGPVRRFPRGMRCQGVMQNVA